jgi:hypothetical protein
MHQLGNQEERQQIIISAQTPVSEPPRNKEIIDLETLPTKSQKHPKEEKIAFCDRHGKASICSGVYVLDQEFTTSGLYDALAALKYQPAELRHLKSGAWISAVMIQSYLSKHNIPYTIQNDKELKDGNPRYQKQALMIYYSANHFSVVEFNHEEKSFVFYDALQSHNFQTVQQYFKDYKVSRNYWSSDRY